MAALQEVRPDQDIRVVGAAGNFLIVRLGGYRLASRDPPWAIDEVEVFARILRDFPDWDNSGKGFITVPPLERDRGDLRNNDWERPAGEVVEEVTGREAQTYSWKWSGVPMEEPGDMAYAHDLALRMLNYG